MEQCHGTAVPVMCTLDDRVHSGDSCPCLADRVQVTPAICAVYKDSAFGDTHAVDSTET